MELFADTANQKELETLKRMGILSGVTTNPSIAAREGSDLTAVLQTITELLPGIPVFGQVTAVDMDGMMEEARRFIWRDGILW